MPTPTISRTPIGCSACGVVVGTLSDAAFQRVAHFIPVTIRNDPDAVAKLAAEKSGLLCLTCTIARHPGAVIPVNVHI